jgi:Stage II sporulation protein E (SpoIIE)
VRRLLLFLGAVLSWVAITVPAHADAPPVLRITTWPQGFQEIPDGWRFHPGDNPAWAQPGFDDHSWTVVSLGDPAVRGLGYRWLRLRLQLPPKHGPMVIGVWGDRGAYQLFVNGRPAGTTGFLPALEVGEYFPQIVALPAGITDPQLALRIKTTPYNNAAYALSDTIAEVVVGTRAAVSAAYYVTDDATLLQFIFSLTIDFLLILGGLAVLALYFNQRSHHEYVWLGVLLVTLGVSDFTLASSATGILPVSANALCGDPTCYLVIALQIEFTFAFVARRVKRPWRIYQFLLLFATLAAIPVNWTGHFSTSYLVWEIAATTPGSVLLPILLFLWYRRGNREAGWLIVPSLFGLGGSLFNLGGIAALLHWQRLLFLSYGLTIGAVGFSPTALANFLFLLAIGVVIFLRFARVSRAEARSAAELDAAREIQRSLIPLEIPAVEGCHISAAYLPAEQVGGDFYQVLAQPDGSAIIVVGDVSGKGLRAAMTGTLAIGALRSLAATDPGPAALLVALNHEILGAHQGGFITMICARIASNGEVTLANAGHLHPYRNGEEIVLDSGLPLGTTANAVYSEAVIHLAAGDTLTFMSDGVVEARNAAGELFGFDRTQAIACHPAGQIAEAAQSFGQQDDITVLTLAFAAAEALRSL